MNNIVVFFNTYYLLFGISSCIIGLIIGSFLTVVIHRLPIMLKTRFLKEAVEYEPSFSNLISPLHKSDHNLMTPRSHCPNCGALVTWWQNVPLISYLILQGKCASCQKKISWYYPAVEVLTCLSTLWIIVHFGVHPKTLPMLILTWTLIPIIFIDIQQKLVPDCITLPLIWFGLLLNTNYTFTTPIDAIYGAVGAYMFLWCMAQFFKFFRKTEGMGYGDFKLFAVFGAWLGWKFLPIVITGASIAGVAIGLWLVAVKKQDFSEPLPFAPYLAVAGWLTCLYGMHVYTMIT